MFQNKYAIIFRVISIPMIAVLISLTTAFGPPPASAETAKRAVTVDDFAKVRGVGDPQAETAKRAVTVDDFAKVRGVGDPQRSPDGKWVAYTVSTIDMEKDKRDTDIWMVSWDGTEDVRLTSSPDGESSPRWSPDGRYLAFLASRGTEEERKSGAQVWLLDRRGGEARRLTELKGGVSEYSWSPDGKRLVIVSSDPDPSDEPEKMDGWKRKTKPPIIVDRYRFKADREGYLKTPSTHLWLFDVGAAKAEELTKGSFDDGSPVWSPDGNRIAFVSNRGPDPDRSPDPSGRRTEIGSRSSAIAGRIRTAPRTRTSS